jgi:RNA polymerase sigma-70 factor (ECF subfamily)
MNLLDLLSDLVRQERATFAAQARAEGVSPEDAVDCVQEGLCTFLLLARKGELDAAPAEWGPLLATMIKNAARNRRRRHFVALPHVELADASAEAPLSDEVLVRAEEHLRLKACVSELCEIQKAVVTLRMLEERSGEDVAQALGITAGHVAVLLHRAKRSLRDCMGVAV